MRIVFFGNFGAGNLGNECTLQTAIEQTYRFLPQARLLCLCTNPEDVRTRHGIAAARSTALEPGWSWADVGTRQRSSNFSDHSAVASAPGPASRLLAKLRRLLRVTFIRAPRELAHWLYSLRLLTRADILMVPGTGIVTDHGCGSLGWPYDMFKLSLLARLCRARVAFLSVGVGPFHRPLGRWFIKRSLRLAHYRSYRDEDSRLCLQSIGFDTRHDAVYPDLVFGLSPEQLGIPHRQPAGQRIVGLGLKDYSGADDEAQRGAYRDYLNSMADFVCHLHQQGFGVRLIIGDVQYDTRVREDLIEVLKGRSSYSEAAALLAEPVPTVQELLRQLRETDAVVSPRFHNLVLALMLNKPVIALSDLPKVDALLSDLGLAQYCLRLADLRSETLIGRFGQLQSNASQLKPYIDSQMQKYRAALNKQYESLFAELRSHQR